MTATYELRRMLDERGVEWWQKKRHTCWKVGKGQEVEMWRAWEAPDGSITLKVDYIYHLTPEQAIAATLGRAQGGGCMSRTDIPPAILAWSLRRMAGDGSVEWVTQPIRTSELLDVADMLDENTKLRELCVKALEWLRWAGGITCPPEVPDEFADELRELGIEVEA